MYNFNSPQVWYISGKITDTSREKEIANLERLNVVARRFKEEGKTFFNPADLEVSGGATWEFYLSRDLIWIYENKPHLFVLKGWEDSRGAKLEVEFARTLNLPITFE